MKFLYRNDLVDSVLTSSSEDAAYPVENIADTRLKLVTRSISTTLRITRDAGAGLTYAPDAITINAHNISDTATIKIQGNATDAWGGPTFSEDVTWNENCITHFFTGQALRYWSLYIDDPANADGYIEIGHSLWTNALTIHVGVALDYEESIEDNSLSIMSPSGQPFGYDTGADLIGYNLHLPKLTNTEKQSIRNDMYKHVRKFRPFYFIMSEGNLDKVPALYCIFKEPPSFKPIGQWKWSATFSVLEARQ